MRRSSGSLISATSLHISPRHIDDRLDEDAALIPRMILVLRKLARIREAASRPAPLPRRNKVGLTIPAPAAQARTSAAAVAPDPSAKSRVVKKAAYAALEQRVAELRKRPVVPRSEIDGEAEGVCMWIRCIHVAPPPSRVPHPEGEGIAEGVRVRGT